MTRRQASISLVAAPFGRDQPESRLIMLTLSFVDPDPMYGPAVRCKRVSSIWRCAVLHQCIRPLIGACCAPGHHGYQRACDLISGQASTGPFGSPVFARAGKTDPPSRLILSQTSAGNRLLGLRHLIAPNLLQFLCSCLAAVPSSRPALVPRRRAQGAVKAGRRAWLASGSGVSRPRLDGPEHGATLKRIGTLSHPS